MCGFVTEFSFENSTTKPEVFESLLALSAHRGPDSTGIVSGPKFQLGFNRLSILDLSEKGDQPKQSPTGRYQVVFNGEIYNFKALIHAYNLKNLNSTSDTEVIVQLLDAIGPENTIKALNGMFAITIVDTENDLCYLARDFAGIKPLFYGINKKGLVSASQFDQVFKHPWFENTLQLRPEMVKEYFGLGYMQAPNTIYEQIFQVNPGELIEINWEGHLKKTNFLIFDKIVRDSKGYSLGKLETTLKESIKRQLVSDVSVATFLSGGIDSPLISAYAKKGKPDIEAFTLKVDDEQLNESEIARNYASDLKLNQEVVTIKKSELLKSIDEQFKAFSDPFGDYSSIPTFVITREAKKRHSVMLSGDGGDEVFYGYPRMLDVLNKRWWFVLPYLIRKNLARITNRLGLTNSYAPYYKTLDEFILNKHLHLPQHILDQAFQGISFTRETKGLYKFKWASKRQMLQQLRWNEFYAHLQRVLIKVDRSSMFHSLEVRVPFLDKASILEGWKVPADLKNKSDLKKPLKELLTKELSDAFINEKKMGFSVPLATWLRKELKEDVLTNVFEKPFFGEDVINVAVLQHYVTDFFDQKHNNAWGVWHIYSWQKWYYLHH